jgi:hypothetical protein
MQIAIDFDGTIAEHQYPLIGPPVPGAFEWMRRFQLAGAQLILWTMRSGRQLDEAVKFCRENDIEFYGVNTNPTQKRWTQSPKAYAHIYIDDAAYGCPLLVSPLGRAYVDWSIVGPDVLERIKTWKAAA